VLRAEEKSGGDVVSREGEDLSDIDVLQSRMSGLVLDAADRLDGFFGDERYDTYESNRTVVRLIGNAEYHEEHGLELFPQLRLNLVLPQLQNRLRLIVGEDSDDDISEMGDEVGEDTNIALRWMGRQTKRLNLSFDLGLRYRDSTFSVFGRGNSQVKYPLGGKWGGRTLGRIFWYTDTGWRFEGRQYFESRLSDRFLFRSRSRVQWYEEEDGVFPEQIFSLYQRLSERQAVAWEALAEIIPAGDSLFDEDEIKEEDDRYGRYQVRARYRVNLWRPWLFFEVWPMALFPQERDYGLVLGVRLRLEIFLGHMPEEAASLGED